MKYHKQISGLTCNMRTMLMRQQEIDVIITSDELGKTMSISDGDKMITIPLEKVDALRIKE